MFGLLKKAARYVRGGYGVAAGFAAFTISMWGVVLTAGQLVHTSDALHAGEAVAGFAGGSLGRHWFEEADGDALPSPRGRWLDARVEVSGPFEKVQAPDGRMLRLGHVTLVSRNARFSVSRDTDPTLVALLQKDRGKLVAADVTTHGSSAHVNGVAGRNDSNDDVNVLAATDDTKKAGEVYSDTNFEITGTVRAEEEAGGKVFYETPVKGKGESADPNVGYVPASKGIVAALAGH